MIVQAWAADGVLVDPPFAVEGHAGILEAMSGLHAQYPAISSDRRAPWTRITTSSATHGSS